MITLESLYGEKAMAQANLNRQEQSSAANSPDLGITTLSFNSFNIKNSNEAERRRGFFGDIVNHPVLKESKYDFVSFFDMNNSLDVVAMSDPKEFPRTGIFLKEELEALAEVISKYILDGDLCWMTLTKPGSNQAILAYQATPGKYAQT